MPHAANPIDGVTVYFEDDGGEGVPVILHGGLLDCVDDVRESGIARALSAAEFRAVYIDHPGLGRSDKPHEPTAYVMPLRVADAVAVLDELDLERAHFLGMSWGRPPRVRHRRARTREDPGLRHRRPAALRVAG